jgi:hypothetical protein
MRFFSKSENPSGTSNPDSSLTFYIPTAPDPETVRAAQEHLAQVTKQRQRILFDAYQAERAQKRATIS